MHNTWAWLCALRVRAFRRRRDQRFDELVTETDDLVRAHVAADHAVAQPRLEWLIENAPVIGEIRDAASHEIAEQHLFGYAAATRMQHANECHVVRSDETSSVFHTP